MCCNEDDGGEVDAAVAVAAALLSRPATNALAASATVAVLLAHHCYTTAHYTIYIYKYASI